MPYLGLIYLVILVIALIDIITTDDGCVRGMPKVAWVVLVVMALLALQPTPPSPPSQACIARGRPLQQEGAPLPILCRHQ